MAGEDDSSSSLRRMKKHSSRSDTSPCKDSSADYQDVFGGPRKNLDRRKSLQDFSSLWGGLPDLNQNIMAEIVRRRNVTEEFYDDIFKGKSKETTACVSSSKTLDPFLSRSNKHHEATKICTDQSIISKKAASEYPIYGEKVRSWKDWIPEEGGNYTRKAKQGLGHGAGLGMDNGDGGDEFGSYVIEFDSHVKKEAN